MHVKTYNIIEKHEIIHHNILIWFTSVDLDLKGVVLLDEGRVVATLFDDAAIEFLQEWGQS